MKYREILAFGAICVGGVAAAQSPSPPRTLPPSLADRPTKMPALPLTSTDLDKQRQATIKALQEDLRSFDSASVGVRQVEANWCVMAGAQTIKDFGLDRTAAETAATLLKTLGINQMGKIAGARPAFDYWLRDGKAPQPTTGKLVVLPLNSRAIRAESVGGAWVLTDRSKVLHDFGADGDAANKAAAVYWKYGFNQAAVVGVPRPVLFVPLLDTWQAARDQVAPLVATSPLSVLNDVTQSSLLLPGNVYAGSKVPFDIKKLEVKRTAGEWFLRHEGEVLARFGSSESQANAALRTLQEARPTELAKVGKGAFPLFLAHGVPVRGAPLGATPVSIRSDRLRAIKVRESWWVASDARPFLDAGTQEDAELLVALIRFHEIETLCLFGRPESGGLRLLTKGR